MHRKIFVRPLNGYVRTETVRFDTVIISIRTQAVRLHKNFVHFRYSLHVNVTG